MTCFSHFTAITTITGFPRETPLPAPGTLSPHAHLVFLHAEVALGDGDAGGIAEGGVAGSLDAGGEAAAGAVLFHKAKSCRRRRRQADGKWTMLLAQIRDTKGASKSVSWILYFR